MDEKTKVRTAPSGDLAADSLRARAATVTRTHGPAAAVARRTAARLWGVDVLPPGTDETTCPIDVIMGPDAEHRVHDPERVELPAAHVLERAGVRLTSPVRTALDCARWLPRAEAVAALDQFLRRGVTVDALRATARSLRGYHGNDRLRAVLRAGDPGAQSPGESRTRMTLIEAGLPPPATQIPVPGPRGDPLYVDLGYERFQVGVEYDGERHHTGRRARSHDETRRNWLRGTYGWELIVVTKDIRHTPAPYVEAVLTALLTRGWTPTDAEMTRIARRINHLHRLFH
ncbi:hypothetical protein [Actinomadura rayongensis]|uniref:DUF559 domain-containing protein n=1 Tax=Actinomadura rayongensis TaxID=1429076 RepID=A0A6I4WE38_9ACTN|nr:hypothetical protein [Actinomadura rayongensis]MXQ67971.1 hypothetical protein [Actinomadura rayongensis]